MGYAAHWPEPFDLSVRLKLLFADISINLESVPEGDQQSLLNLLEDWQHANRRQWHRKPSSLPVRYVARDRVCTAFISNISDGGVFIQTLESFSPGEYLTLMFSPPNQEEKVEITGQVVWRAPDGIGVKFIISQKLKDIIEAL